MTEHVSKIAAIVIGRNEGNHLVRCFDSLIGAVDPVVYVDSSSTDHSVAVARSAGVAVEELDPDRPFTAARARNCGLARVLADGAPPDFVQFVDGDCEVQSTWIALARAWLEAHPQTAVVCGRRRERHPEASLWNRLIDAEWDTPIGEALACGGDAMMRTEALQKVGVYNESLIAGEEPELCFRLRRAGWHIHRLDAEMTLHDAAMTRFSQWWKRARRAGHAFAEGSMLHGSSPERYNVARTRRALLWGAGVPFATALGALVSPYAILLLLAWPLQVLRLGVRRGDWTESLFLTLGKLPEAQGVIGYYLDRLRGRRTALIEYK